MSVLPWKMPTGSDPRKAAADWDRHIETWEHDQDRKAAKLRRVAKRQAEQ